MTSSGKTNVVFFGSGPVAARCLELLIGHTQVEVVITKPQPPHHKSEAPVLAIAKKHSLKVLTAQNKAELDSVIASAVFNSHLAVLIDFGIIVSQKVIDAFPLGIINSHFSLLPHLRGADPITFSILNGDTKTGVSLMMIDTGMDTGKLLTYRTLPIARDDTAVTLTDKLITLSDNLLQEFIPKYIKGDVRPKNQPHPDRATYSRKLTKQDGSIDWTQSATAIERKIRAHIEWPGSRTTLGRLDIIITKAHAVDGTGEPGKYSINGKELTIFAQEGALSIDTLKPAGKKEMPIQAFLAGYKNKL